MKLKRHLFNSCIVPAILYGSETWALTKAAEKRLATAERRMERYAIGIRLIDRKTNEWIRGVTKFADIVEAARRRKWRWAKKVANMSSDRWTRRLIEWQPRIGYRGRGRPPMRWRDELKECAGSGGCSLHEQMMIHGTDLKRLTFVMNLNELLINKYMSYGR